MMFLYPWGAQPNRPARNWHRPALSLMALGLVTCLVPPTAHAVIDLRVGPLGWTAPLPGPVPGEQTPLVATVINDGTDSSPAVNVNIWKNWTQQTLPTSAAGSDQQQTLDSVPPGLENAKTLTFNVSYGAVGTYFLLVVIDVGNTVQEFTKDNNAYGFVITVIPAGSDLIIESIVPSTDPIVAGQAFQMAVGIKNQGRTAVGSFSVAIFKNLGAEPANGNGNDGVQQVNGLASGQSTTLNVDVLYDSVGDNTFWALANQDRSITEPDMTNDAASVQMTVVDAGGGGSSKRGCGIGGDSPDHLLPILTVGLMLGLMTFRRLTRVQ